uniref:Uncharacterized protein n=2 Tax=Ixodes scapularis TaxID=6945 RepID=A0A1S4LA00_IXOSC
LQTIGASKNVAWASRDLQQGSSGVRGPSSRDKFTALDWLRRFLAPARVHRKVNRSEQHRSGGTASHLRSWPPAHFLPRTAPTSADTPSPPLLPLLQPTWPRRRQAPPSPIERVPFPQPRPI